jgi:hypothetical protein
MTLLPSSAENHLFPTTADANALSGVNRFTSSSAFEVPQNGCLRTKAESVIGSAGRFT